jgi:hypothetical protein
LQLVIASELLSEIRSNGPKKPFGKLHCDVIPPSCLVARRLAHGDEHSYSKLVIDTHPASDSLRIPWIFTDPPLEEGSLSLEPRLPLGALRLSTAGPQPEQPFLKQLLEDESGFLLIIGQNAVRLLRRRPTAWKSGPLWIPESVAVSPFPLTNVGLDPNLKGRAIGIVGTGSIGGRLAVLLAAGGVQRLVLVDPDYVDIRNLRRHVCGVSHLGQSKVEAIKDLLDNAGYEVDVKPINSSLPRGDSQEVREHLASCDVLASCAASGPAQHYVNHLARHLALPAVIASVKLMPQALGEVVHCLPNSPGCLNCWRLELEAKGLIMREDTHDPADYPGQTAETPQGLPAYLLDQLAAVACNLVSRGSVETDPRVWLHAMERPVDGFEDLRPQEPRFGPITPMPKCLVCQGK